MNNRAKVSDNILTKEIRARNTIKEPSHWGHKQCYSWKRMLGTVVLIGAVGAVTVYHNFIWFSSIIYDFLYCLGLWFLLVLLQGRITEMVSSQYLRIFMRILNFRTVQFLLMGAFLERATSLPLHTPVSAKKLSGKEECRS